MFVNTSPRGFGPAASPAKFLHYRQQTEIVQDVAAFKEDVTGIRDDVGNLKREFDVNQLVDRFFEARKMMKQMAGSLPGMRRATKRGGKKGKKGKGGGRAPRPAGMPRLPGGLPAGFDPSSLQLPPGMSLPPGLNADLSNLKLPPER